MEKKNYTTVIVISIIVIFGIITRISESTYDERHEEEVKYPNLCDNYSKN